MHEDFQQGNTCGPSAIPARPESLIQIETQPAMKKFKPSRFNAHTDVGDGSLLIYNSYTGHNCAIPATAANRAKKYLSKEGCTEPLDKLGQYLLRQGYLVEAAVDEGARWDVRYGLQQYRNDILDLILLSSEECNLRCVYCSQEFKRETMLPEIRRGVLNLIRSRIKRLWALNVSWFGGEPLLGYEAIEEIAPAAQTLAAEHGVEYVSGITTNGYLLTPERSLAMLNWGVSSYQITIDGSGEIHDSHRPLKGGGSSYQQILENVAAMKSHPGDFKVYLRTNFDRTNVDRLRPLFEEYRARLGNDSRFIIRLEPVGKWGGPNDDQLDICGVKEVFDATARLKEEARSMGLNAAAGPVGDLENVPKAVCYAARPYSFIVGADGKLMKCTVVLDTLDSNVVGRLRESGELQIDEDRFAEWVGPHYRHDSMCSKCFFVPACQGGFCPLPRVAEGRRACPSTKVHIQRSLQNVWEEKMHAGTGRLVSIASSQSSVQNFTSTPNTSDAKQAPQRLVAAD